MRPKNSTTVDPVVCVVDDDPQMREALQLLLITASLGTLTFESAEAFLASVADDRPICVVIDVRLPGMNGLELLQELRSRRQRTVAVMITGHGDVPMAVSALRAGAFHFIEKPFDPQTLLESIEEALQHLRALEHERDQIGEVEQCLVTLTPREEEVLALLIEGMPSKLIAIKLGISPRTAEHHRAAVMRKMKAPTLSHLVRMALMVHRSKADR
jgi:FixJ family two-component response regulator